MSIITSEVTVDRLQADGSRKIREEHIDNIGKVHTYGPRLFEFSYDKEAGKIIHALEIEQQLVNQEIAKAISAYESGLDGLHFEQSENFWVKITPDYQTWDELAAPVLINFLERENQLELTAIESTIIRISTNDTKALLGMTNTEVNNVNSAIQVAVNTQATLDTYSPFFVDGVKQ